MLKAKEGRRIRKDKESVLLTLAKEETRRLNADIPVSLHRKLKIRATEEGRTITELLIELLEREISSTDADKQMHGQQSSFE